MARALVPLLVFLLGFKAWAGGFSILDIGTRKTGMGAVVGRPDDLSAIYHNPAGLTLSRGTNLYLSSGVMFPQSDFQLRPWAGSERYIEDEVDGAGYYPTTSLTTAYGVIPMLTASTDLGRDDLVVALGIYVPNAIGGSFEAASPARFHMIESYVVGGYLTAAIAYRLHETFSLGAAASLVYVRTAGQRKFFPVIEGLDLGPLLGGDSTLSIDGDDWKVRGTLGMLWTPHPRLSVGAAVLTRVDVALEGDITLRSGGDAAREFELQGTHVTELLFPWIFQLGANVDVLRWLEVGFEVRYFLYSQFEEQRTRVEGIDIIDELVVPKNYRNSIQGSGGVRATLPVLPLPLEVMLGLHYDRTPAPVTNVSIEQPSFHHVGLHSGLRLQAAAWLRLALTYAHFWYLERATDESVHRSPPSNYRASASGDMLTLVTEVGF